MSDDEEDDTPSGPRPPSTWMEGCKAIRWGRWQWSTDIYRLIQVWGDSHACRFILVSEVNDSSKITAKDYYLVLYIAPKPNSLHTGLCERSVSNRDRNVPAFTPWLEGFLAGQGVITPGEHIQP